MLKRLLSEIKHIQFCALGLISLNLSGVWLMACLTYAWVCSFLVRVHTIDFLVNWTLIGICIGLLSFCFLLMLKVIVFDTTKQALARIWYGWA